MSDWLEELLLALNTGDTTLCAFLFCDHLSREFRDEEVIYSAVHSGLTFWFHLDCLRRHQIYLVARQNWDLN